MVDTHRIWTDIDALIVAKFYTVYCTCNIILYYLTCTVKYHDLSRHVSHKFRRHECDAVPWWWVIFHSTRWIMYLSYAFAHVHTASNHSYYISITMNIEKQRRFFKPWAWLEHLVETSASCTLSIKLSTKNLRCFSTATATENDVSSTMNMDSINDCEPFSLESLLHPDIYSSIFDDGVLEQVLEPSTPLLDLPIPPSIDFPERNSRPQNSEWYSDSVAAEPSPVLDDAELE